MAERSGESGKQGIDGCEAGKWVYKVNASGKARSIYSDRELATEEITALLQNVGDRVRIVPPAGRVQVKISEHLRKELERRATRQVVSDVFTTIQPDPLAPPKHSQFILSLVAPLDTQEEVLGDLDERFLTQVGRYGLDRARVWYRWQVAQITLAIAVKRAGQAIGLAKVIGFLRS